MMAPDPETRLRADARRNRDQILTAAREMFAVRGPDTPMEEIAHAAGVGVGTLYRRFPDREALIRAVAQQSFAQLLDDARAAAIEEPTAWQAFTRLVGRSGQLRVSVQLALTSTRAREILHSDPTAGQLRDELLGELTRLVRAAQAEGSMRSDIGPGDVVTLVSSPLRQPPSHPDLFTSAFDRALGVILDGLRADAAGTLPGRPLSIDDLGLRDKDQQADPAMSDVTRGSLVDGEPTH